MIERNPVDLERVAQIEAGEQFSFDGNPRNVFSFIKVGSIESYIWVALHDSESNSWDESLLPIKQEHFDGLVESLMMSTSFLHLVPARGGDAICFRKRSPTSDLCFSVDSIDGRLATPHHYIDQLPFLGSDPFDIDVPYGKLRFPYKI